MFTIPSVKAALAALLLVPLATPAALAADEFADFRGGGHLSNFENCPDWPVSTAQITARIRLVGGQHRISIFSPIYAYAWYNFDAPDEDGWQRVQQTGVTSGEFTNDAEILVLNPSNADTDTDSFNMRFRVRGFPSGNRDCTVDVRLNMRQHH